MRHRVQQVRLGARGLVETSLTTTTAISFKDSKFVINENQNSKNNSSNFSLNNSLIDSCITIVNGYFK